MTGGLGRFLELCVVNDFPCPGNLCLLAEQDVLWMGGRHNQRTTPSFLEKKVHVKVEAC